MQTPALSAAAPALQDLAVVVLLMLIPLLAPSESGAPVGLATISKALGIAAVKVRPRLRRMPAQSWLAAPGCLARTHTSTLVCALRRPMRPRAVRGAAPAEASPRLMPWGGGAARRRWRASG